jgi:hypothetical protein
MKPSEIKTIQEAAGILMVSGATGAGALEEAALALSAQLTQWLAQRLRTDAQQSTVRNAARKAAESSAAPPLRKSA